MPRACRASDLPVNSAVTRQGPTVLRVARSTGLRSHELFGSLLDLQECAHLNLPNAFAREREFLGEFFERWRILVEAGEPGGECSGAASGINATPPSLRVLLSVVRNARCQRRRSTYGRGDRHKSDPI